MRGTRGSIVAPAMAGVAVLWCLSCGGDDGDAAEASTTATAGSTTLPGTATEPDDSADSTTGPGPAETTASVDEGTSGETTDPTDPTTGEVPPNCGDGVPDADEACDDGNMIEGDGCNTDCTVSGSVLWFHSQAGGVGQNEDAFAVVVDAMGRAYVGGEFYGEATLDFWVRQYTEDDGLGWTQAYDGAAGNDGVRALALGGDTLYAAGYALIPGQNNDMWLRAFDLDGNAGLNITYNDVNNGSNVGNGVAVDPEGNVVVATSHSVLMASNDILVHEYSPAGALVWSDSYGGVALSNDQSRGVAVDGAGNVAVVGFHTVAAQGRDIWVRYYDTNGVPQWTVNYGSPNALDDEAWGVAFDPEGNVVVAGFELDPVIPWRLWLSKYDPSGVLLWSLPWDGATAEGARAFAVAVDEAGDIVMTGQHREGTDTHLLVRKVSADGVERWVTNIEGAPDTNQVGRAITIGPNRRIWVAGGLDLGVDGRDVYVARLAP